MFLDDLISRILDGDLELTSQEAILLAAYLKSKRWQLEELASGLPNLLEVALAIHQATSGRRCVREVAPPEVEASIPDATISPKKWVQATRAIEHLIASGERYTSERDLSSQTGFSLKTVQTALKRSEALQRWKISSEETEEPAPPPVESLSVVHLDRISAPEESTEVDEEEIQIALNEILDVAEPAERESVESFGVGAKKSRLACCLESARSATGPPSVS